MIPVQSDRIAAVDYNPETHTLYVDFHKGGMYAYYDVSPEIFKGLLAATSKGEYFGEHIKKKYRYQRV